MKKSQFMGLFFGALTVFTVSAKEFNVGVENHYTGEVATSFSLQVTTNEIHSAMCGLQLTKLEITNPIVPLVGELLVVKNLILEFASDPHAMCLMAFGPHRGGATLQIGSSLPMLTGAYNLIVNGEDYGKIRIGAEEGATLDLMAE